MCFVIQKKTTTNCAVYGKSVFFDTNCYRGLARQIRKDGVYNLDKRAKELKKKEKKSKNHFSSLILSNK